MLRMLTVMDPSHGAGHVGARCGVREPLGAGDGCAARYGVAAVPAVVRGQGLRAGLPGLGGRGFGRVRRG
ncbi:hypothetical protein GCM10018781_44850 [Kitasatospora indigofera]|uniref:Uncharacterized protein n=1 Tax=Kitasatospora indigofera TaxID=67307 RepID=A0A919FZW5_9ACTN|nr:hypothetical protein GCM10018781_44850 [Kitasatospora indigofera]